MALPEDPNKLPLRRAYVFLENLGFREEAEAIRVSQDRLGSYKSTLRCGKIVALLKDKGVLDDFIAQHWPNGGTDRGKRLIKFYEGVYQRFLSGAPVEEEEEAEEDLEGTRFAYEADLRDYLANNLHHIENGLTLWTTATGERAVEYPVDSNGRRIDILAKDKAGIPVVIELKVSKGHERTIGQALYYRGKVKELFNVPSPRVIIVARDISSELLTAAKDIPWVSLFEYRLAMMMNRIQ